MARHKHAWRRLYDEGRICKYLASGNYGVRLHATVYGCDCGKQRREKPVPSPAAPPG